MERTITDLGDCKKEMKVILTKDEIQERLEKAFASVQPNINIKGFRKGKVPLNVIKRLFGKEIEAESLNEYAVEIFNNHSKDNELKLIGEPTIQNIDRDENGATITYHYFSYPEFDLLEYKGLQILEPIHSVTEEEIDKEIEKMRYTNGKYIEVQKVENEDCFVKIRLEELDKETLVPIIGKSQETHIHLKNETVIKELKENMIGKSIGDSFVFNPNQFDKYAPDTTYSITILGVTQNIPIELDTEFVSKYSDGRITTVEELREEIGYKIQDDWNEKSRIKMEDQIIDKLSTMHDFEVPQHLVYSTAIRFAADTLGVNDKNKKDVDQEKLFALAKEFEPFSKRIVKWKFIKEKIAQKENIEVEEYDVEALAEKYFPNMDIGTATKKILDNPNLKDSLLEKKVLEFLLDFAITTESTFEELEEQHSENETELEHNHEHDHEHCDDPTHHHDLEHFDEEKETIESAKDEEDKENISETK